MLFRRLRIALLALGVAACDKKAAETAPASAASVSSAPAAADASIAPSDPLARVRALGPMHREPFPMPGNDRERLLALIGPPTVVEAAWVLAPGDAVGDMVPILEWPLGTRVIGHVPGTPYLLVESLPVIDQPAGLRGVVSANEPRDSEDFAIFAGVKDLDDAKERARRGGPEGDIDTHAPALEEARKSPAALAAVLPRDGADVHLVWQSTFTQPLGKVDAASLAKSPYQARIFAVMNALTPASCAAICDAIDDDGATVGTVVFGQEGRKPVIRAFFLPPPPPAPPAKRAAPHVVAPSATTEATMRVLRPRLNRVVRVIAEAPLYADAKRGAIGVALADAQEPLSARSTVRKEVVIAIDDGLATAAYELATSDAYSADDDTPIEARFADVDGDGRTDVVLRLPGPDGAKFHVFRAPGATVEIEQRLEPDAASKLAVLDAINIETATARALAVNTRGASAADVCKLLAKGLPAAATDDARVFTYDIPADLAAGTTRAKMSEPAGAEILKAHASDIAGSCPELKCEPGRPVCWKRNGPGTTYYFLTWSGDAPKIAAAAFYTGS